MSEHNAEKDTWRYRPTPAGVFAERRSRGGSFGARPPRWRRLLARVTSVTGGES